MQRSSGWGSLILPIATRVSIDLKGEGLFVALRPSRIIGGGTGGISLLLQDFEHAVAGQQTFPRPGRSAIALWSLMLGSLLPRRLGASSSVPTTTSIVVLSFASAAVLVIAAFIVPTSPARSTIVVVNTSAVVVVSASPTRSPGLVVATTTGGAVVVVAFVIVAAAPPRAVAVVVVFATSSLAPTTAFLGRAWARAVVGA